MPEWRYIKYINLSVEYGKQNYETSNSFNELLVTFIKTPHTPQISPSENIFRFGYLAAFLFSITCQTFLYTYYGNGILESSNLLSTALYSSKWYKMLPDLNQTLVIFMERLKRKSEVMAGNLFPLNLELFKKVSVKSECEFGIG